MSGLISAIVPTYNRADYLVEAVAALRAQTRPLHQIIVWNDGSSDHTAEVMKQFVSDNDTQILCFSADNAGKSKSLNQAMKHATGEYIWICDDDDIVTSDAAAVMGACLDASSIGLVAGRHERFQMDPTSGKKITSDTGYWPDLSSGSVMRHVLEDIFFFQPATLVRRNVYDAVGPFNENLNRSIDYDMFVRLVTRFSATVLDTVLFEQRKHDGDRGAAGNRHVASQSEAVWKETDREIFAQFRDHLPISLYEGMFEGADAHLVKRAGLLQRGCTYARRSDWTHALEDFELAIKVLPDRDLTATEHAIAVRSMAGKHGCSDAFRAPVMAKLLRLRRINASGKSLCRALARGAVWRGRAALTAKDTKEAARVSWFITKAGFPSEPAPSHETPPVVERAIIPAEVFAW